MENNDSNQNNILLVFYILAGMNLVYVLLLVMFEFLDLGSGTPTDLPLDIFTIVFSIGALLELLLAQLKLIPNVKKLSTIQELFSQGLFVATLYTSIAIFGFFYGILQIFVLYEPVNWIFVGPFLFISFLLQIFFINNVIKPKMQSIQDQALYS